MRNAPAKLDARPWNLLAGLALVGAGCSPRLAGDDGDAGSTGDGPSESETAGPECVADSDCPVGYACVADVCEYIPAPDGWTPYYDCYTDDDCQQFEVCDFGYCASLGTPPPDCGDPDLLTITPIPIDADELLGLSFADVDADGLDELVLATADTFTVHGYGGPPTTGGRFPGGELRALAAGSFDDTPGEDLLVLSGAELRWHGSNGDGSFAPALVEPAPLVELDGLLAGELAGDAQLGDVLGWGPSGAFVLRDGQLGFVDEFAVDAAAAHGASASEPGFVLRRGGFLSFHGFDGALLGMNDHDLGPGPLLVAALTRGAAADYVTIRAYAGWSAIEARDADGWVDAWVLAGVATRLVTGDLDGDGNDELVLFDGSNVAIQFDPTGPGDCWHAPTLALRGEPVAAVFGDFDGDGDEELAIATAVELVLLQN